MDPHKKTALIKWLDALADKKTQSFNDVRDGVTLITILKAFDSHYIPADTPVDTVQQRFEALRTCLESFYHQSLSDNKLIDFDILIQNSSHGPVHDWEMGKLLLALLGALVQGKHRELFVNPAFTMDERSQMELKAMIESVLFVDDTNLPVDFDQVLKRNSDTTVEHDATQFLKLVADGMSSKVAPSTPTAPPMTSAATGHLQTREKGPVFSLYTNSPGGPASPGMSIREISSPLRVMSLNSPVSSPLAALMQSPQLAQKALLRQKMQEIKRLELTIQHQEHLRSEMELDVEERAKVVKEKEKRIRELERQQGDMRSLRDQLDELEQLKADREKLSKDNTRLQTKLSEYQDLREHCQALERENQEAMAEVERTRKEQKEIDELRWSNEELLHEQHRLQLLVKEQEAEISHRQQAGTQLTEALDDTKNMYAVTQQQVATLRQEKEELEEMLGNRVGMNGELGSAGESMSVVIEKRLSDLQEEFNKVKSTWIDPEEYTKVKKQLEIESEAKKTVEEKYIDTTKKLLSCEDDVHKLTANTKQYELSVSKLETSLQEERDHSHNLQSQLDTLTEKYSVLEESTVELQSVKDEQCSKIENLKRELSQCHTELALIQRECEVQQEANETRRQTIAQLDGEKLEQKLAEQRLSSELNSWKNKAEDSLQQLAVLKKESTATEDKLKAKIQEYQQLEKQLLSETEQLSSEIEIWKNKNEETRQKLQKHQEETESKVKQLQDSRVQMSTDIAESNVKIQKLHQEKDEILSDLNHWKSKTEETGEQLQWLQSVSSENINALQQKEKQLVMELNMWKDRVEDTTQQLNTKVEEVNSKDEMLAAINIKLQQLEHRYHIEVDELNSELKSWKSRASRESDDYNKVKLELTNEIKRLQQAEQQQSAEAEIWRAKVDDGKEKIKCLRQELSDTEEKLKAKIESLKSNLTDRETEKVEAQSLVANLKVENAELEKDIQEVKKQYGIERRNSAEKYEQLELKFKSEQNLSEERAEEIKCLSEKLKTNKANAYTKEESLATKITSLCAENKTLELELHKVKLEFQSAVDSYNTRFQKNETKLKDCESNFTQDIDKLKARLEQQYQIEKKLRIEITKLNQDIEKYKDDIENLNNTIKKLGQEKNSINAELEKSKLLVIDLQIKLKNSQELYDHECEQNLSQQTKKDAVISELEKKLQLTMNEFDMEKSELTEQLNSLHETVARKSKEYLQQKETLLKDITSLKIDHERALSKLKEENTDLLSEKEKELSCAKNMLSEIQEELETKKSYLIDKDKNFEIIKAEYENMIQEKVNTIAKLNQCQADLELKFSTYKGEAEFQKNTLESELESAKKLLTDTEDNLQTVKETAESEVANLREKLVETESYWRAQCEQLEEEYNKGASEQKEEYQQQVSEATLTYEEKLQQLSDEKDMFIANQQQEFCERIHGLERVIGEKKEEIQTVVEEKEKLKEMKESEIAHLQKQIEELNDNVLKEREHHRMKCEELDSMKQEVVTVTENKKTELEKIRETLGCENAEIVKNLTEEHKSELDKLKVENEEQKTSYQGIISDLEGKLASETSDLKERLSQMKCQYETIIETNQKEARSHNKDLEKKLTEAKNKISDLENELSKQCSTIETLQNSCSGYTSSNSELQTHLSKVQSDKSELADRLNSAEASSKNLTDKLGSLESDLKGAREEVLRERGEREEVKRQLNYLRDQNDTLSAELSSQQQQLAAVEEEKRVLEVERSRLCESHTSSMDDLRVQSEKDLQFINIEKMELERQLQSSQKCYEAVEKSQKELEGQLEHSRQEKTQTETRLRELEQRVFNYMEREKKITEDNQHQVNKAAELNGILRRQLDEKCHEVSDLNSKFGQEVENMQLQFSQMKDTYEKDIRAIREEKTLLEIEAASLDKVKDKLKETEAERKKLQDINEKYNVHYNKKKEMITTLTQELEHKNKELDELTRSHDKMVNDVAPLSEKYEGELMKNKGLNNKVRTLEAQLDLAERKIRDYRNQLEKSTSVFLGDNSEFQKMINCRENASDASFMEKHPASIPFHDSDDDKNVMSYDLRPRHSSLDQTQDSITDDTLTPGTRASRSRHRLSKSISNVTLHSNGMTPGAASIGSASSLAYRLRSRESAVSLHSVDSVKSTHSAVPRGTGGLYMCEDEPVDFEWGRLGELQRRNTLCPAHLKTSYPVETQTCKPGKFQEAALRESTMGNVTQGEHGSGRKRKHQPREDSSSDSADNRSKQAKAAGAGTVYQKPGPPTPANSRRNSGKGTSKSPNSRRSSKGSRSPKTPLSLRGRWTPGRRTPRKTPKRTASLVSNLENTGSGKKSSRRESVAFNIGFSPLSNNKKSLRRQQGFIQKQPQSSSQTQTRKPLGVRNFLQTGV